MSQRDINEDRLYIYLVDNIYVCETASDEPVTRSYKCDPFATMHAHDDGQVKMLSMDDAPCWESRSPSVKRKENSTASLRVGTFQGCHESERSLCVCVCE